jgi:hypothetical protein
LGIRKTGTDVLQQSAQPWGDGRTHLGGEVLKRVSLDGVDGQGVVAVNGGETGRD